MRMGKRDVLEEILAKRQRITDGEFRAASGLLQLSASADRGIPDEVSMSLHVVGIVACIEVAARDAMRKLIDSGDPYDERVGELLKGDIRFTLDIARAFHDRKVSLGEFVAHLLPISSLTQIIGYFDVLLGSPFQNILATVKHGQYDSNNEHVSVAVVPDVDGMIRSVGRAFAARHVIAHEAGFTSISENELRDFLSSAILFDKALFEFLRHETGPEVWPSAQRDSLLAMRDAYEVSAEMHATCDTLAAILASGVFDGARSDAGELLRAAQTSFDKHVEDEVAFRLALYNPASGSAMHNIEAMVTHALCATRAEALKDALNTAIEWIEDTKLRSGA